jgi:hypothetical protein
VHRDNLAFTVLVFGKCNTWFKIFSYFVYTQHLIKILKWLPLEKGARSGAVSWGTALQGGRLRVRFPMVSLQVFIDLILPAALWPWSRFNL